LLHVVILHFIAAHLPSKEKSRMPGWQSLKRHCAVYPIFIRNFGMKNHPISQKGRVESWHTNDQTLKTAARISSSSKKTKKRRQGGSTELPKKPPTKGMSGNEISSMTPPYKVASFAC
jgi:hypothetical protein